jgi:hypothetical protein
MLKLATLSNSFRRYCNREHTVRLVEQKVELRAQHRYRLLLLERVLKNPYGEAGRLFPALRVERSVLGQHRFFTIARAVDLFRLKATPNHLPPMTSSLAIQT